MYLKNMFALVTFIPKKENKNEMHGTNICANAPKTRAKKIIYIYIFIYIYILKKILHLMQTCELVWAKVEKVSDILYIFERAPCLGSSF